MFGIRKRISQTAIVLWAFNIPAAALYEGPPRSLGIDNFPASQYGRYTPKKRTFRCDALSVALGHYETFAIGSNSNLADDFSNNQACAARRGSFR